MGVMGVGGAAENTKAERQLLTQGCYLHSYQGGCGLWVSADVRLPEGGYLSWRLLLQQVPLRG